MKNAAILKLLALIAIISSGCAATDPVTHNPGWQVPDKQSEEEKAKESEVDLREIF